MASCRGCGMTIEFIEGPNGKRIPAHRVRNVYRKGSSGEGGHIRPVLEPLDWKEPDGLWVSHFETCPKASTFSRRR